MTGTVVVGTAREHTLPTTDALPDDLDQHAGGDVLTVTARSVLLLQRTNPEGSA